MLAVIRLSVSISGAVNVSTILPSRSTSTRSHTLGSSFDLARDEDDALSGCSELADDCVNPAFGFDVDATCRLVEQKQAGAGVDPPTDNGIFFGYPPNSLCRWARSFSPP